MPLKSSHALLAALALIAAPAFAQDTAPTEGATPDTTEEATPAPATETEPQAAPDADAADDAATDTPDDEAAAAEAEAEPRLGTYYLMAEHQDWTLRCIRTDQPKDPCEMYKLLVDEDDNA
ncbi:MAG: invasion associated locus B family protein, partial [Paracoccus sp. (in: a-proteobacteria)]